jgi:hypothetical protein
MHHDARGLVHDEEMLVGVADRELRRRNRRLLDRGGGSLDLDLLPACELVALPAGLSVHEHGSSRQQPLCRGPGAHVGQPGEIAVEPLSRGLGRDPQVQRVDARGSRSARRSAASRIPTPITMKLSARLNAGQ